MYGYRPPSIFCKKKFAANGRIQTSQLAVFNLKYLATLRSSVNDLDPERSHDDVFDQCDPNSSISKSLLSLKL